MRLGIDLDGVVADFNRGWMDVHGSEFGSALDPTMVTTWDGLHDVAGFDHMGQFWRWARGRDRPTVFRHLVPFPKAMPALSACGRRVTTS